MVSHSPTIHPSNLSLPEDRYGQSHPSEEKTETERLHQCHVATSWQKTSQEPKLWPLLSQSRVPSTVLAAEVPKSPSLPYHLGAGLAPKTMEHGTRWEMGRRAAWFGGSPL